MAKKIEMLNDQQEVVHPLTSSDCVVMENGKSLEEVMGDGIATPTVTHEGASFQVGVGDSNIEVVDGDVAGMTLEGQTYQNILPKPTTLIMETDEKEFKINDKIDNNIVLDDNIAEIATVKGQTYVNVVQEESATEYTVLGEELSGQSITTTGKPEGVIKNATLEGMTLVNTIQEPSEANSVVLDLDADINAQSTTIDNTVQGGIHGAKLNGMTLVNLVTYNKTNLSTSIWNHFVHFSDLKYNLKSSTKYLLIFNITNCNVNSTFTIQLDDKSQYTYFKGKGIDINGNGVYKTIRETKDDLSNISSVLFTAHNPETTSGTYDMKIMIIEYQEGIENLDIPYFEGMKSVEVPSVKTTGKNLFDGILKQGYIGDNSGVANTSSSGVHSPNYMKVKPNTTYIRTISGSYPSGVAGRVYFYDMNKTYLGIYKDGATFVTPENAHYIRFRYFVSSGSIAPDDFSGSNIQIEEGSTATTYEPYQSSNTKVGLLPILETEQGCYYSASTGTRLTSNPNVNSVKYEVQGLSKVYVKVAHSNFSFWDSNDTYISGQPTITGGDNNEGYLGIPTNSVYMRCAVDNTKIAEVYKSVTLRKVGDVQDELDLETGKLTQRIGEVVLNGSESGWFKSSSVTVDGGYRYALRLNDGIVKDHAKIMCDKFVQSENAEIGCVNYLAIDNGLTSALYFNSTIETVDEFKQWLSQNHVTVQYQLETPIIRQVDLSIVDQSNKSLKTIQAQPTLTHITTSSNGLTPFVSIPSRLKYPTIIKPSTQYTLKLKRDVVDSANQLTVNVGGVSTSVTSNVMTITTPDTLTSQDIVFTGKNNVVSQLQLIEGDVTGVEYPYFEGMLDVKSPKLYTTGKNLISIIESTTSWNGANIKSNNDNTITLTPNSDNRAGMNATIKLKTPIKLRAGTQFTYSIRRISGGNEDFSGAINSQLKVLKKDGTTITLSLGDLTKAYFDKVVYKTYIFEEDWDSIIETLPIMWQIVNLTSPITIQIQLEQDSTATSYEPYKGVTIEQGIDSIPLTSSMFEQGRFNDAIFIKGMSLQQLAKEDSTIRIRSSKLIPVKPNAKYIINVPSNSLLGAGIAYSFDKNGAYNGKLSSFTSFTTKSDTYFIAGMFGNTDSSTITPSSLDSLNLTLQEVPQEIVLRSLPNGVKDTLNLTTGEYVQRIGEVVLDGSRPWNKDTTTAGTKDNTSIFYTEANFNGFKPSPNVEYRDTMMLCDKLPVKGRIYNLDEEGLMINGDGRIYIRINLSKLETNNVAGFKSFLAKENIKIECELATPIITKVNLTNTTKLPSYNSTTHYDTIVPSNSLIPNIKLPSTIDYNVAIKPSTQYTVRCNTTNALSVNLGGSTGTLANGKVTLTTPSTLAHSSLKLGSSGKAKEVMVIESNEIKDNVPFFNGMKNVQMGGIKLVNIARGATCNSYVTTNANKTQFTYTANGTNWGYIIYDASLLKPNTTYTMFMNVITNQSDNNYPVKFELGSSSDGTTSIDNGFIGKFKSVRTSITKISNNLRIGFRPCTSGQQVVIQNPMIIEGDWTHLDEIPYIESEMIIEQPIIRSQGKNLFDGELEVGTVNSDTGLNMELSSRARTKSYIEIKPNTSYSMQVSDKSIINRIYYFDSSKKYISNQSIDSNNANRVSPQNAMYIRLSFANQSLTAITNDDINNIKASFQIEEGSTSTTYEPFKHQTLYSNRVIGYEEGCYYHYGTGNKETNEIVNSMLADVEGLSIAYVTGGSSNYTFWDKDNVFISGKRYLDTSLSSYDKNGFIAVPSNAKYMRFAAGMETNYKIATVTGELPLRSLPNGVCDTLNLVTGEYVQRVGEVVLDGSEDWSYGATSSGWANGNESYAFYSYDTNKFNNKKQGGISLTNKFTTHIGSSIVTNESKLGFSLAHSNYVVIRLRKEQLADNNPNTLKQWLSQNPITVQYELATPIVRKIGLTAKGNYKEIELNGSEEWGLANSGQTTTRTLFAQYMISDKNPSNAINCIFNNKDFPTASADNLWIYYDIQGLAHNTLGHIQIRVNKNEIKNQSIDGFKQWLSQNHMKVGYLSTNSASLYSNIQKPIFFNDVKVQFMNDNVDIQPTLTLQSTSRNSYVMDMMKANTRYTLKALANPKSFTIDGTSYNATTNGTFTSPSTLTNKLLITGQDVQELMIIEGDVTGKKLPYYKGIRSSFDNTNKVEVLSQTRNLFNYELHKSMEFDGTNFVMLNAIWDKNNIEYKLKPNTKYTLRLKTNDKASWIHIVIDGDNTSTNIGGFTDGWTKTFTTNSTGKVTIGIHANTDSNVGNTLSEIQLEEGSVATPYQPHKENSTIINMSTRWETVEVVKPILVDGGLNQEDGSESVGVDNNYKRFDYIPVQPNDWILIYNNSDYRAMNCCLYDINKNFIKYVYTDGTGITIPKNCYFIRGYSSKANTSNLNVKIQRENPTALNKLPNGVKDELIINRATSSVKLIRRVGKVVLDGSQYFSLHSRTKPDEECNVYWMSMENVPYAKAMTNNAISDNLPYTDIGDKPSLNFLTSGFCYLKLRKDVELYSWLKQNPITVYYELAEPVVTEISLKGYPYVYKDGSVQLNTEIPHTTKVKYNVNQEHLINGQNETIIRHDKQIDNLYDYIELYLEEEYRMELFRMQLELSL